ncbi:MAG: hypothetical protein IKE38_03145 [Erysipelotrichaceae bacterium]|nr:hypothetical protein [Erysipelotrichaceae bacterium]
MKKVIRILLTVLLLCFTALGAYTGWQFLSVYKEDSDIKKDLRETAEKLTETEEEINELNKEIESLSKDNTELYTEYTNWQRQNRKLEEILKQE